LRLEKAGSRKLFLCKPLDADLASRPAAGSLRIVALVNRMIRDYTNGDKL